MRGVCVFALVLLCVAAGTAKPAGGYTTKFDNVDLDEILANKRLLKNYVNCLLDKGNCSPDGAELKKALPDALEDACAKCSDKQKAGTRKVIIHLMDNEPEIWEDLSKVYDPTGELTKKYCQKAKDEGVETPKKCG